MPYPLVARIGTTKLQQAEGGLVDLRIGWVIVVLTQRLGCVSHQWRNILVQHATVSHRSNNTVTPSVDCHVVVDFGIKARFLQQLTKR